MLSLKFIIRYTCYLCSVFVFKMLQKNVKNVKTRQELKKENNCFFIYVVYIFIFPGLLHLISLKLFTRITVTSLW